MALDFHLGNNQKEATYSSAYTSLDFQSHQLLFQRFDLPEGQFPLFKRLSDYFKDASYCFVELENFANETREIKALYVENSQLNQQLDKIINICEEAIILKTNIWVFCD